MMLYTGNNGITKGFAEGDTAAEKIMSVKY